MNKEVVWVARPSQWLNFGVFASIIFVVTIPFIVIRWFVVRNTTFKIDDESISYSSGAFSRGSVQIPLKRVESVQLHSPLFLRLFKLSNVYIKGEDINIVFAGVRNGSQIKQKIDKLISRQLNLPIA